MYANHYFSFLSYNFSVYLKTRVVVAKSLIKQINY